MADNKYITQHQENGSVMISEEVLVTILDQSVTEVDGVSLAGKPGINWGKGIKLTILDENQVEVKVYINVDYNHSVSTAACAVQDSVRSALESMTGVEVTCINVNVCGVVRQ